MSFLSAKQTEPSAFDTNTSLAAMRDEQANASYYFGIKKTVMTVVGGVVGGALGAGAALLTLGAATPLIPAAIAAGAAGGTMVATLPLQKEQAKLDVNQRILDNAVDSTKQNNYNVASNTPNASVPLSIAAPSIPATKPSQARAA
jgi:hypothetical protein